MTSLVAYDTGYKILVKAYYVRVLKEKHFLELGVGEFCVKSLTFRCDISAI